MVIQCNKGFSLNLYYYRARCKESLSIQMTSNLEHLLENEENYTLYIKENTTYELDFIAQDAKARLYIEGIGEVQDSYYDIQYEQHYVLPNNGPFVWFKWDVSSRGMIPGSYYIKVLCQSRWYYGILKIQPRYMDSYQLDQMKEDVEEVLLKWRELPKGIQESIEEKSFSHGVRDEHKQMEILMKWHTKLIPLLSDLKRSPYEQIEKTYHYMPQELSKKNDQASIRKSLKKTVDSSKVFSYTKVATYETQENKWLKCFNERLLRVLVQLRQTVHAQEDKEIIKKVEVVCQQLRSCEWYQKTISKLYEEFPIRSRYDSRYRTLFQIDNALQQGVQSVGLKRTRGYLWLETSWIYELWCFLEVYKALINELGYEEIESLSSGYVLNKRDITLKLYYDTAIPLYIAKTNSEMYPLYARSPYHTRPDGRLDVYKADQYYGSIILEFKYSSYYNVWNNQRKTRCSEQLLHYGYQIGSPYLVNPYHLPEQVLKQMNPIYKVMAIMPKIEGDLDIIEDRETNIVQVGLRVGKNNIAWQSYIESLVNQLTS